MTEGELRKVRAKADTERSAVNDAMIAAGRGYEKAWDTLAKAKLPDADPLTLRFAASGAVCSAIRAEQDRRMGWHGSLRRIPATRAA